MTALAQGIVKGKTLLDHGFSLFLGHGIPQFLVSVTQAYELHWSLLCGLWIELGKKRASSFECFATR
jgi:hypothetical protein